MFLTILIVYFVFVFVGSLRGASAKSKTAESYFLADRGLSTLALFFTILATNFSAFYFLGFAGEGYRIGYAYYIIMALGTAFACLSFYLIGTKVWTLGKQNAYITPAELIYDKTKSRPLSMIYAAVMILFTFPYLALQIVGAGYLIEQISGGLISYFFGAALLTLFTIIYVWIGGMSSVAKTDLKQGLLAFGLMLGAVIVISTNLGGFAEANEKLMDLKPALFEREGVGSVYTPQKWFSLLVFWIFCIPMFPQIFMRFYIAKDLNTLKRSGILYGFIPIIVSIFPVIIGVFGHLSFPGLEGKAADQILPMMLVEHSPEWFSALVMTGALAAFMSTLDSQLLALSTIVTRDFYTIFKKEKPNVRKQVYIGRIWVVILAIVGLAIAANPFDTIFDMGRIAFAGLSLLFPVTYAILHWKKVHPFAAIASVVIGEILLLLFYYEVLPKYLLFGFDLAIPLIALCFMILLFGSFILKKQKD